VHTQIYESTFEQLLLKAQIQLASRHLPFFICLIKYYMVKFAAQCHEDVIYVLSVFIMTIYTSTSRF